MHKKKCARIQTTLCALHSRWVRTYNVNLFFNSHAQFTLELFPDIPAYSWTFALSLFNAPSILPRNNFTMEVSL